MLDERQVALSAVRMQSAKENLLSASESLQSGRYKTANNRAYYVMFHAIRAVFALDSKDFKSHAQSIGYFNRAYIHTGDFDERFLKAIRVAAESRTNSDYEDYYFATKEEAATNIESARLFLETVESYLARRLEAEYVRSDSIELQP
jgi:uncharacterized protein (UPF0332 family)